MHAVTGCFHLTVTKDSNLSIILSKNYFNTALSVVIICIDIEAVKINTNVNPIKKDHACKIDICSKTNVKSCVKNLLKISLVVNVNRIGNLLLVLVITLGTRSYEVNLLANCLVVRSAVRVTKSRNIVVYVCVTACTSISCVTIVYAIGFGYILVVRVNVSNNTVSAIVITLTIKFAILTVLGNVLSKSTTGNRNITISFNTVSERTALNFNNCSRAAAEIYTVIQGFAIVMTDKCTTVDSKHTAGRINCEAVISLLSLEGTTVDDNLTATEPQCMRSAARFLCASYITAVYCKSTTLNSNTCTAINFTAIDGGSCAGHNGNRIVGCINRSCDTTLKSQLTVVVNRITCSVCCNVLQNSTVKNQFTVRSDVVVTEGGNTAAHAVYHSKPTIDIKVKRTVGNGHIAAGKIDCNILIGSNFN